MTRTAVAIAALLSISAPIGPVATVQDSSAQMERLDPQIGPPAPALYKSIRDVKDWENPYLVIRQEGIEVTVRRLPFSQKTVSRAALRKTLTDLPLTAWPYGRIVAVAEIGLRRADKNSEEPIADNLAGTLAILNDLDVTVDRWPP